ncbi:helix-turn-helix transcriptional regulator [Streptomyces alkaliterrae]|uniref:Helix-turn-helix transcriptional regulator n=1 Tax=Streptomyces alkaliterrae TaxID=2213162 RepID=A0A5P0YNY2_9ACTN|nr:LuxR C-terminal-related transcriptional regulator [Streptomyces alkaliterrae]MBB1260955.1 helix-turn-helix transcriptional regulator [Streptomyces alkaliterrae]MQS02026.1 helix-turn-helix transcriptional regulator [Streptomyces alkaliterrae]
MTPQESGNVTESDQEALRRTGALLTSGDDPVVLLLAGAAGTGKSELVRRLLSLPEPAAAPRLELRCTRHDLVALVAPDGDRDGDRDGAGAADPGGASALTRLAALARGTGRRLLVVDDVHLANEPVAAVLRDLLERPSAGLSVVLAHRPEELPHPGLPLREPVGYPAELTVLHQELGPRDEEWTCRAALAALGADRVGPDLVARLHRLSGGVAQVVADLLRILAAGGLDDRRRRTAADVDAAGVPPRLADLVLGRAARLTGAARELAHAAAVLDEPASLRELARTAGLPPAEAAPALTAALAAAVVQQLAADRYGFAVPLAARALAARIPGPERARLHRAAGEVLAGRQPVPWARVAEHRRDSGHFGGWARAVERAASGCAQRGEHQRAVRLLEEALGHPSLPAQARVRLAPLLANSAVVGLRSDQTVGVLRHIVEDRELPAEVRGRVRLDLGLLLANQLGLAVEGRAEMERAVEELGDQPALTARVMSSLAIPYWPTASFGHCMSWLRRAQRAAEDSGDETVKLAVAANTVSVLLGIGDPDAWRLLDELPRDGIDPADSQHVARGLCNCADAAVLLGHYDRAAKLLEEGLYHSARSGASYQEQTGHGTGLLLDWSTGRWAGLAGRCEAHVAESGQMPMIAEDARVVLGQLALARGDWTQMGQWLDGEGIPAPAQGSVPLVAAASGARIRLALARDDVPGAAKEAAEAWARMRKSEVWVWAAELAPWAVEATVRHTGATDAHEMVTEFAAGLEGRDAPSARIALLWCQALLAEADGEPATAVDLLGRAGERYAELGRPYQRALTAEARFRCAHAAEDGGLTPDTDQLTEAVETFVELGAIWDASRARALLRAHRPERGRRSPGRPGYGDRLSPREREVAELAAAGLTNREIGATLHLSPRTVEQHVARAMRKLGIQSRQDLVPD